MKDEIIYSNNGKYFIEDVPVDEIEKTFGTPAYVYSKKSIVDSYKSFDDAFKKNTHLICFAVKANPNLAILNILANQGAGFDIVSGGELQRVIAAKGDPKKVVFSGIGKSSKEIELAIHHDILAFNIESEPELYRIQTIAKGMGKIASISIRVNPNVDAKTHPYISTGLKDNKFGVDEQKAIDLYKIANDMDSIAIKGIDCHIGSQITELSPFVDSISMLVGMIEKLKDLGIQISHLDVGGGIGINYNSENPPDFNAYAEAILPLLEKQNLKLIFEPGRAILGKAGVLLTKVEYVKKGPAKNFAIIDAAMNDLMRPSLYNAHHDIINTSKCSAESTTFDVVGPVCETGDFIGKDRNLSLAEGNLLAVVDVGAYGMSMSSNYNSRVRPVELLVDGDKIREIRKRENFSDLIRGESII
ncbi:MAG: diaminopimelate decarboxylase [Methylophilales bacterium BACL14 MAG-120920-bin58]|jgi:diaminopimelate decarboxylase|nr:MAG: diaminopimelate decarboxylase [Methylophilales bacterium BACL14 MAG-120920-bin58]